MEGKGSEKILLKIIGYQFETWGGVLPKVSAGSDASIIVSAIE